MLRFILYKLVYGILVMFGVLLIVFFLFNVLPGDPARMMLDQRADSSAIAAINKDLGLDEPLPKQLALYINDLSPVSLLNYKNSNSRIYADEKKYSRIFPLLNFGNKKLVLKAPYLRRSFQTRQRVNEIITQALPATALLAFTSMLFASFAGIGLGIFAALNKDKWSDRLSMVFAVLGMAVPSFFAAIIIAWLFGFVLGDITGLNMTGSLYRIDPFRGEVLQLRNLILPTLTLGIRPLSVIVQLMRSSMLDVLSQDYIRTAKAKGLTRNIIVLKHALKNALNPVITAISGWFGSLLAGAVFIEYIFGWKGIGKLTVDALEQYDFPVVMGAVLVVSFFFVVINIIVDIIYGLLDPRVRIG